jgi:uncharacterized phage infection (PIP) family protein YhgE
MQESTALPSVTDELEAVAQLLQPEPEKAEEAAEPEKAEPAAEAPEPEKEQPGAEDEPEKAEIDYGMKVPITGAEPVTLGELKDLWQSQAQAKLDLIEERNELIRKKEQSETLINFVESLPPHVQQLAQQRAADAYQRQTQDLMVRVPEVKTQAGFDALRAEMSELAREYAAPPEEVGSVQYAWAIHMMRDLARYKQAIRDAKANVKPLRSETPKAVQAVKQAADPIKQAIDRAKQTRNSADETAAVDALLRKAS